MALDEEDADALRARPAGGRRVREADLALRREEAPGAGGAAGEQPAGHAVLA